MRTTENSSVTLVAVVALACVGLFAAFAGWIYPLPELDRAYAIDGVRELFESGRIPQRGNVTSFASFGPPGATWFLVPGYLATTETALWEPIGCSLLYVIATIAIYALARRPFGTLCAGLAAAVFALSSLGIFFARTGLGYGHAGFYAAFLFLLWKWVDTHRAEFVAGALFVWCVGMYTFLTLAPAILAVPLVWCAFRPPLVWRSLMIAAVLAALVWAPYLWFDAGTGFSNISSQLTQSSRMPSDFERTWNNPGLRRVFEEQIGGISLTRANAATPEAGAGGMAKDIGIRVGSRIGIVLVALTTNFGVSFGSGLADLAANVLLAMVMVVTLIVGLSSGTKLASRPAESRPLVRAVTPGVLTVAGSAALVVGVAVNEWTVARFLAADHHLWPSEVEVIRAFQGTVLLSGCIVSMRRQVAKIISAMQECVEEASNRVPSARDLLRFCSLAYLASVVPLIMVANPAHDRRFYWLWPVQCLLLAFFLVHLIQVFLSSRRLRALAIAGLVGVLLWPRLAIAANRVVTNGIFGKSSAAYAVIDAVAAQVKGQGRSEAWIGYHVPFAGFEVSYNVIDSRYKVGAQFDLVFRYRHKITNRNVFAEGVHPNDEYRIVAPAPQGMSMNAFAPVPASGFQEIARIGTYTILKREGAASFSRLGDHE